VTLADEKDEAKEENVRGDTAPGLILGFERIRVSALLRHPTPDTSCASYQIVFGVLRVAKCYHVDSHVYIRHSVMQMNASACFRCRVATPLEI
jgi:hypothetical protein